MIDLQQVFAVARAEMRLNRRLVRYWVFLVFSYLIGFVAYFYYSLIHAFGSSWSASAALISPRYLMGAVGMYYVVVFMVGIVFLGFDLRARDRRERMDEVLDSRPYTNLELVLGRFTGLLMVAWIPVVIISLLIEGLGLLLPAVGSPVGELVEPWSMFTFVVFMAIPAFAFTLALVFLVTLLVRNRLLAAVVLLVLLGLNFWAWVVAPLYLGPLLDINGGTTVGFPSDIMPMISDGLGWLQRFGLLVAAASLLVLAAAVHPRLDGGSRGHNAAVGVGLGVLALALLGSSSWGRWSQVQQMDAWRAVHSERADDAVPDLVSIVGEVRIDPGRALAMELDVTYGAPQDQNLQSSLFTFNPGLRVTSIRGPGGQEIGFSHSDGLLEIETAVPAGETAQVHLTVDGRPNVRFGYLESARDIERSTAQEGQIGLLGYERGLFDRRYVALTPGIRWLPAAGSEVGRDDPGRRVPDFYDVELEVVVPGEWLVAGPGRRHEVSASDSEARFRFVPGAPVPETALLASRFTSVAADIEGVHMEGLFHPGHTRNIELLDDAAGEITSWIGERLRESAEVGLEYPYDGFTLVEIPTPLRGFAGGWRLDTAQAPPAMVMMRELGFPTARFDFPFRNPEEFTDREGGLPRAKRERLQAFFVNDFSGGNVFIGLARNYVVHQTAAHGAEGLALNYVLEHLSTLLVTGTRGYFSAHMFSPELNQAIGNAFQTFFINRREGATFADAVIEAFTTRPAVWEAVLGVALQDMDPWEEPSRTIDVLTLKGGALSQSILDGIGRESTGALLAALLERYRGRAFTEAELVAVGDSVGVDLQGLLDDWLETTDLPGFVASRARGFRLPDSDDGSARYQLLVGVRNDEPVPGLVRIEYSVGSGESAEREQSDPIRLEGDSGQEFGVVVSRPPSFVAVFPYLSLNREPFAVFLPTVDEEKVVREEPFDGLRDLVVQPPDGSVVVVDDLDDGFSVGEGEGRTGVRLGAKAVDGDTDQGLPSQRFGVPPAVWSRMTNPSAWGTYRHTVACVRKGKGNRRASFTAEVPSSGAWDLELHMPGKRRFLARKWGSWNLVVIDGEDRHEVSFDSAAADRGWNLVDTLELSGGEVTVELTDKTDGQMVIADAIRWTPAATGNGAEAAVETVEAEGEGLNVER